MISFHFLPSKIMPVVCCESFKTMSYKKYFARPANYTLPWDYYDGYSCHRCSDKSFINTYLQWNQFIIYNMRILLIISELIHTYHQTDSSWPSCPCDIFQWHSIGVIEYKINGDSTVCSAACSDWDQQIVKYFTAKPIWVNMFDF